MISRCKDKWELHKRNNPTPELEDCSLEDFIKYVGRDLVRIKPDARLGEVVEISARGVDWAAEWALVYNNPRDHHSMPSRIIY